MIFISMLHCANNRSKPTIPETHLDNWMISSSEDFHGKIVLNSGSAGCQQCHGIDFDGGKVDVSCINCHAERTNICTGCHGGISDQSGAPPFGLRGETSDTSRAVGAHTAHLDGSDLSGPVNCSDCHSVPAFTLELNHFDSISPVGSVVTDSIAEIIWGGFANGGTAIWDGNEQSCSGTYCHGTFDGGNQSNLPIWNQNNQAECGSCHDIGTEPGNLQWKHQYHITAANLDCADCHASVVDSTLAIVNPNLHINGSPDTLTADTSKCNVCHGDGPISCTSCHGGLDNSTGAPPFGLEDETLTSQLAVGAHTTHIEGGSLADPFECSDCHIVPVTLTANGHLGADNIAELNWSSLAGNSSTWNRTTAECSNIYCHGNFSGGYSSNSPIWTGTGQANCGSCHDIGANPEDLSGKHKKHFVDENIACRNCHSLTQGQNIAIVGPQYHIDGEKTVSFSFIGNFNNGTCSGLPNGCHGSENWYD